MPKPLSLSAKLDRFPPVVIRILARISRREVGAPNRTVTVAMTDLEVARAGGLTVAEVRRLSSLTSWGRVEIDTLQAFLKGCGADLDDRDWLRKNAAYMANIRSIPRYLRQSPDWSNTFEPLLRILVQHEQGKTS